METFRFKKFNQLRKDMNDIEEKLSIIQKQEKLLNDLETKNKELKKEIKTKEKFIKENKKNLKKEDNTDTIVELKNNIKKEEDEIKEIKEALKNDNAIKELKNAIDKMDILESTFKNKDKEIKEYIKSCFVPLSSNGYHVILNHEGNYELITQEVLTKVYLNRFGRQLSDWYLKAYTGVKHLKNELNKPLFYDDFINIFPQLPEYKPYKEFSEETRENAHKFLDYTKEVICSGNDELFDYVCKWVSNVCMGKRNEVALVLKTFTKGSGKSSFQIMLRTHILKEDKTKLSVETGSSPLRTDFNGLIAGKILIAFEELESFGKSEWLALESKLKSLITSPDIIINEKFKASITMKNISNSIIVSNYDFPDEERRYFPCDISTHRVGDTKYWNDLRKSCFNDEVGSCLYSYFREIDTSNFNPREFPLTTNKQNSMDRRLDTVYKFLKEEYLLQRRIIKEKPDNLYKLYEEYCLNNSIRNGGGRNTFCRKLREIGLEYRKTKGIHIYDISIERLEKIAKKFHWIHELDEYVSISDTSISDEEIEEVSPPETWHTEVEELKRKLDNAIEKNKKLEAETEMNELYIEEKDELILKLKKEIRLLKKHRDQPDPETILPLDEAIGNREETINNIDFLI